MQQLSLFSGGYHTVPTEVVPAVCVCLGFGWDSTAMLIRMVQRGERPALITFADVGAEKRATYDFLPVFTEYLVDHGFPAPKTCTYQPRPETHSRYRAAVLQAQQRLNLDLSPQQIDRLSSLYGNLLANQTLPSQAFGLKGCSMKWKVEAQEPC